MAPTRIDKGDEQPDDVPAWIASKMRVFTRFIRSHLQGLSAIATLIALLLGLINTFAPSFLREEAPSVLVSLADSFTSPSAIVPLLLTVVTLQVYNSLKMKQLAQGAEDESSEDNEPEELPGEIEIGGEPKTDGGQPRGSDGKFKSKNTSSSDLGLLLVLFLAGMVGFSFGSQYGSTEGLIGGLLGVAVAAWILAD